MPEALCRVCKIAFVADEKGQCKNCGAPGTTTSIQTDIPSGDSPTSPGDPGLILPAEEDPASSPEADDAQHAVLLEYQHPVLKSGQGFGRIPVRFTNLGKTTIREISFYAKSLLFRDNPEARLTHEILPGENTTNISCSFTLKEGFGTVDVTVFLTIVDEDGVHTSYSGTLALHIRDSAAPGTRVVIDGTYGGDYSFDIDASEIVLKQMYGDKINFKQKGSQPFFDEDTGWIKARLAFDHERTRIIEEQKKTPIPEPRVHVSLNRSPRGTGKAILVRHTPKGSVTLHLFSGNRLVLGRNGDMICSRLPHNTANQKKNNHISQKHVTLEISDYRVAVLKDHSTNGTYLNGKRLSEPFPVKPGDTLSLANALALRIYEFRNFNSVTEINHMYNNCRTVMDCSQAMSSLDIAAVREKADLDAILLRRTDTFKDRLEYLFLVRSAVIGSSLTAAIHMADETVNDRHARLTVENGVYYIEDLHSESGTWIDDKRLTPYERIRLNRETTLRLGETTLIFRT